MIFVILDHQCHMRRVTRLNYFGTWLMTLFKLTKTWYQVALILREWWALVINRSYLEVLELRWVSTIFIKNLMVLEPVLTITICIFKKLFKCMKVMAYQVSHQLMSSFI
jgi:hypothetical protein